MTFPTSIDNDASLYLVRDSLSLKLAEDYNPGDTSITLEGDEFVFANFPNSGIITLTEQCSDVDERAISLFYSGKGTMTLLALELLPEFVDTLKPKRYTAVTMNVMAEHHGALKDALVAIQNFAGIQGVVGTLPLQGTMEARINFLRKLVLKPTAWFTSQKRIGVVPVCLTFQDLSTREPDFWLWDFGDGTSASVYRTSLISVGDVSKCYYSPGIFDVKLTVSNAFGVNDITLEDFIVARVEAPDLATLEFNPTANQILEDNVLRTRVDRAIEITVTDDREQPLDPVTTFVWDLQDDLLHENTATTSASYGAGGLYDVRVKVETTLGAFRITSLSDAIDVVERTNIWHFIFSNSSYSATKTLSLYEFSPITEVYKTVSAATTTVTRNYGFLTGKLQETQQKREFLRNNGFTGKTLVDSGDRGSAVLFWAEGADNDTDTQVIRFKEFNGFDETYSTPSVGGGTDYLTRYWNWLALPSVSEIHFVFGLPNPYPQSADSATNLVQNTISLGDYSSATGTFSNANLLNGATDLMSNPGAGEEGDFSVYRGTWKDSNGYFVRNDGGGTFFRLKNFYMTEEGDTEVENIRKLTDVPGSPKFEGQLIGLTGGLYMFNNTGEVVAYDPTTNIWATGGPGVNSPAFTALQDITVTNYDSSSNTLLGVSNSDHQAYLFFDYSTKANTTFNEIDKVFRRLPERPSGEQFITGYY